MPGGLARSLLAVVREAAANADAHAGGGSGLWVLLEDDGDDVTVSVRDDGPGIPDGRLEAARRAGPPRGRVLDPRPDRGARGHAELVTAPGEGVEWELRVPRAAGGGAGR